MKGQQLVMRWKNDGTPPIPVQLPNGFTVVPFPQLENALSHWLDIVQYGLSKGRMEEEYYTNLMTNWRDYDDNYCFFVCKDGLPIATITTIFHRQTNEAYIHMVACKEGYREMGIGNLLNQIALYHIKEQRMRSAFLTTDDWRIPAIKSYLKIGFTPDLVDEDDVERWDAIFKVIQSTK